MRLDQSRYLWLGIAVAACLIWNPGSVAQAGQRGAAAPPQATAPKVTRVGDVGAKLTDQEVADLEKVLPTGQIPWLLSADGPGPFYNGTQYVRAYLPPTSTLPELRRGSMITVTRRITPPQAGWTISFTDNYAQVAIGGRDFDQIQNEFDINLPFRVMGSASDTDLVSLVKFVRSGGHSGLPISNVLWQPDETSLRFFRMQPGDVEVGLRLTSTSGTYLVIRKQGQTWVVISEGIVQA